MVCVPCVLVPLMLFMWSIIKPILNWFKEPLTNSEGQKNANDNQVCSLLSSCPCINKNKQLPNDQVKEGEALLKEPIEVSDTDKKNI